MMLVELTTSAESDIGDAAVAYELERRDLGFRFEEEVDRVFAAIADNPRQYQIVEPDVRRALVRVFPYKPPHRRRVPLRSVIHVSEQLPNRACSYRGGREQAWDVRLDAVRLPTTRRTCRLRRAT